MVRHHKIITSDNICLFDDCYKIFRLRLFVPDMQEEDLVRLGNLRSFTFKELQRATNNFSSKNILGAGGFGNVYRGKLGDGSFVAVKRLKDISGTAGESQFRTELELISLAVHRNLLRLIGYCATSNERLLVYPYMSNGSVASRLRGKFCNKPHCFYGVVTFQILVSNQFGCNLSARLIA